MTKFLVKNTHTTYGVYRIRQDKRPELPTIMKPWKACPWFANQRAVQRGDILPG